MVVTISTVGYGDITPKTVLGQCMVMGIILFAIIVVPAQIADFGSALSEHYKRGRPYRRSDPHVVLVVPADMSAEDVATLLQELFHSHHTLRAYHVVLLSNGGEEHRQALLSYVRSTDLWSQVSYIVGSPSSTAHLDKAAVAQAQAVLLLSAAHFESAQAEQEADEESLRRAISIKHHTPYVPLIISLNSPRNRGHVLWAQLSSFSDVTCVCLNEFKMRLLATSAMAPGAVGLLTNLLRSSDGKSSFSALLIDSSTWSQGASDSAMRSFEAQSLAFHPLDVSAWPLTSAPCSPTPLPPSVDSGDSSLYFSAASRRWDEEYLWGYNQRLFACELPAAVDGLCFSEAAALLYERLTLVLVALYRIDPDTGKLRVVLSPGWAARVEIRRGDLGCVIGQSEEHADAAKASAYEGDIRARWREARKVDGQTAVSALRCNGRPLSPLFPPPAQSGVGQQSPLQRGYRSPSDALSSFVSDPAGRIDPVTGQALVPEPPLTPPPVQLQQPPLLSAAAPEQLGERKVESEGERGGGAAAGGGGGEEEEEELRGHVVICGFIDSRVVGFLRRFRQSDARPVLLVPTTSTLSAAVERCLTGLFDAVRVVQATEDSSADNGDEAEQADAQFLGYSHPCYGHCHSAAPSHAQSKASAPSCPLDEFCAADRQSEAALRSTERPPREPTPASMFAPDGSGPPLSPAQALQRGSWFRRASVLSAAAVVILTNPYTKGEGAEDQSVDEQSRVDSAGVALYAALRAYLRQCQLRLCPSMRPCATVPLLSIELLYHINVRLLRHDVTSPIAFRPHQPQDRGWLWVYHSLQRRLRRGTPQGERLRVRADAAATREQRKHSRLAELKQSNPSAEQRLDSADRQVDIDLGATPADASKPTQSSDAASDSELSGGPFGERTARSAQQANLSQRSAAFFTSDGRVFSAKLLDSLVVQAFYHPLVSDTAHALTQLTQHTLEGRSFHTELSLLDVPSVWVGRSYGYAALSCMLNMGWVALGVYRDRRAVDESARTVRRAAREALRGGADSEAEQQQQRQAGDGPQYYVLTNPPPDTVLHEHDRIFMLVQRS